MKKFSPSIAKIASITGLLLGGFALSVLATGWTTAPCSVPADCNTDAPINVGSSGQNKIGAISINTNSTHTPAPGYKLDVTGLGIFDGISINADSTHTLTPGYKLDVAGFGMFEGLAVNGLTTTNTLKMMNGANDKYIMTSDATGNATWTANSSVEVGNIDLSSWPRAWYGASEKGGTGNMTKRTGANSSSDDEGNCPPKAVLVGFDWNGSTMTMLCAAPTNADLIDSFSRIY